MAFIGGLLGLFLAAFVLALLPLVAAAFFEFKWREGSRKALLGHDADSYKAAGALSRSNSSGTSGLALWPHGEAGPIGFGGSVSRAYVGWQDYKGRATRGEFWWWYLFTLLVGGIGGGLASGASLFVTAVSELEEVSGWARVAQVVGVTLAYGVIALAAALVLSTVLPSIAVMARRLHDTNKSGWWLLLYFVPLGAIVLLVFFVTKGTVGENKYGADRLLGAPSMETISA